MSYSFEIKENSSLLEQFSRQGLSKETHPHSYEKIEAVSKSIEISHFENKKGIISDIELKEIIDEALKTVGTLI